jgi:hypothetical protein
MRHHRLRSLGFALLAIAGAALLGAMSAVASADDVALIMAGTGPCCTQPEPIPSPADLTATNELYIALTHPGYTPQALYTPEQFAPFTGIHSLPLNTSIDQGVTDLNTAIMQQIAAGNNVVVSGTSQSIPP